jgi:hypothetical protein
MYLTNTSHHSYTACSNLKWHLQLTVKFHEIKLKRRPTFWMGIFIIFLYTARNTGFSYEGCRKVQAWYKTHPLQTSLSSFTSVYCVGKGILNIQLTLLPLLTPWMILILIFNLLSISYRTFYFSLIKDSCSSSTEKATN